MATEPLCSQFLPASCHLECCCLTPTIIGGPLLVVIVLVEISGFQSYSHLYTKGTTQLFKYIIFFLELLTRVIFRVYAFAFLAFNFHFPLLYVGGPFCLEPPELSRTSVASLFCFLYGCLFFYPYIVTSFVIR